MSKIGYSGVARGATILAQQAMLSGNFDKNVYDILTNLKQDDSRIITEKQGNRFYILHESSGLNFIASATDEIQPPAVWEFLEHVKQKFTLQYSTCWKNAENYGMQQEFSQQLKALMTTAVDSKVNLIKANLSEAQETMTEAMQQALLRGETLNEMNSKADTISSNAKDYERSANRVKRKMCWGKYRVWIFGCLIALVLIFIILLIVCDGFTFKACKGSQSTDKE